LERLNELRNEEKRDERNEHMAGLGALASGAFAAVRETCSFRLMTDNSDLRIFLRLPILNLISSHLNCCSSVVVAV
jgi:hypothetical protein